MYPFSNRLQWFLKGRTGHFIAAIQDKLSHYGIRRREIIQARIRSIKRTSLARSVCFALLYLGAIATAIGWIGQYVDVATEVADRLDTLVRFAGSTSAALLALILLLGRHLGQLEADLISIAMLDAR